MHGCQALGTRNSRSRHTRESRQNMAGTFYSTGAVEIWSRSIQMYMHRSVAPKWSIRIWWNQLFGTYNTCKCLSMFVHISFCYIEFHTRTSMYISRWARLHALETIMISAAVLEKAKEREQEKDWLKTEIEWDASIEIESERERVTDLWILNSAPKLKISQLTHVYIRLGWLEIAGAMFELVSARTHPKGSNQARGNVPTSPVWSCEGSGACLPKG